MTTIEHWYSEPNLNALQNIHVSRDWVHQIDWIDMHDDFRIFSADFNGKMYNLSMWQRERRTDGCSRSTHLLCLFTRTWTKNSPFWMYVMPEGGFSSWLGHLLENNSARPCLAYNIRPPRAFYYGPQINIQHVPHWIRNCLYDVRTLPAALSQFRWQSTDFQRTLCSILVQVLTPFPWITWNSLESKSSLIWQELLCCVQLAIIPPNP